MKKLDKQISPNEVKIIELYNRIDNGRLNTHPEYQRKLVWKKQHKYAFIQTILWNFPFPEVYIASAEIDVAEMVAKEVVVDGQQRLTTIVEYIKGEGDFRDQQKIPTFNSLSIEQKKEFLSYPVAVRDLKSISIDLIKEIFQRINSTEYALNDTERNNAQYGDGEIAIFCKQLIDADLEVTSNNTDVLVSTDIRQKVSSFFTDHEVFSDNDKKRMYDFQYLMLLSTTILEGAYFGRSTKVEDYLDRYNSEFPYSQNVIDALVKAIDIIEGFKFSNRSYWFNKANLFTLIVELARIEREFYDLSYLELRLLDLEDKVDTYFSADHEEEISTISDDERKYFEFARHNSHEKATREHRGRVVSDILKACKVDEAPRTNPLATENINHLKTQSIEYARIIPTETGLSKGIMDAVRVVREFLKHNNIHDYDTQIFGPDHKVKISFNFISDDQRKSEMSLYRSNGRGDYRMWFSDLPSFADAGDQLALILNGSTIELLNLSKYDYRHLIK